MAITANVYPPVVMDTLPAFIRTKPCKFYFSLSMYNSITNIKNIQISLTNQRTNASALKTELYPSGIKIANISQDLDVLGDYNYYVQIDPSDLAEEAFGLNQFYKVQLRFTSTAASDPPSSGPALATWLYDNSQYFSEWSKVCLIKGIEQPFVSIRGLSDLEEDQETILTTPIIDIIGTLTYSNNKETEYLKNYNIKLYQVDNEDTVLMDSGEIYTNPYNPNEFNYQMQYNLLDGVNYKLVLTYTTNNLYTDNVSYTFTIIQYGIDKLNAEITAIPDQENGRIKIYIISKDTEKFIGNLTIRRTSSQSNFHKWEDIKTITYATGTELNYSFYDTTIESGVWYKYCAQKRNSNGNRGAIIQIENPVICLLNDIFLTRNDCQLKIKFNPTLNEFKYNVMESQQTTIGSKFPYIKRNGANYFRTFPIGGLISSFVDTTDWYDPHFYDGTFHQDENEIKAFTSKSKIYKESQELYNNYNNENGITEYNDYIYEREFRKKVYDFLYEHNVKLFRSTTEGNILVKLMNIDFQPIESLGRRLYSFTATAVEIDEPTIQNYDKYGIQIIGDYSKYINYKYETLGQLFGTYQQSDGNLLDTKIRYKYEKSSDKNFINKINGLKWLKLTIESDPYIIIENGSQLIKATTSSEIDETKAISGYIVIINGREIVIPSKMQRYSENIEEESSTTKIAYLNSFELKEKNTLITDLRFKYPTLVTIDYIVDIEEVEDTSHLASKFYYYYKPGQLYGSFNPQDSLMKKIYKKYLFDYNKYYQRLLDVTDLSMEGPPGTVVYVKDSKDNDFNRHILENGFLQLKDSEALIEGLYFCGIHLTECENPLEMVRDNEYILIDGQYDSFKEIENPVPNGVYQISSYIVDSVVSYNKITDLLTTRENAVIKKADNNYVLILNHLREDSKNKYIYYHDNWYPFTAEHDVLCPVDGIVNYYCEVMKGVY